MGLCSKNNPQNINYMPAVIFFARLDLEKKSLFMDGHCTGKFDVAMNYGVKRLQILFLKNL